ncbi:MAG: hypothetical protein HZB55_16645 [Deltaproteobacteria bacterium]|nr:hypothetical protein [Deltaproteobacteria bacterium]
MNEPTGTPGSPPPGGKKWLLLELFGGFMTMAGLLVTVYVTAGAAQARLPLHVPLGSLLIPVGLVVHVLGRIGLRRARP